MKTIILNALLATVKQLVSNLIGSGVFAEIQKLVIAQLDSGLTGDQKKQAVKDGLAAIKGDIGEAIKKTSNWALNLAIEVAVTAVNVKLGKSATK